MAMTTISHAQYEAILAAEAKKDLASARRDSKRPDRQKGALTYGSVILSETKIGNIEIGYCPATKLYTLRNFNDRSKLYLAEVKAAVAITFLVANYNVTLTDTIVADV